MKFAKLIRYQVARLINQREGNAESALYRGKIDVFWQYSLSWHLPPRGAGISLNPSALRSNYLSGMVFLQVKR